MNTVYKTEILNENGEWVEGTPDTEGQQYREHYQTGVDQEGNPKGYVIEKPYEPYDKAKEGRLWRYEELGRTDYKVSVTDHSEHELYIAYRQLLRDWPDTPNFPDTRPTLDDARATPKKITQADLIRILLSVGVTPQDVIAAKADASMAFYWTMLEMVDYVAKDDPLIEPALDQLVSSGYLIDKQLVLNAWPTVG